MKLENTNINLNSSVESKRSLAMAHTELQKEASHLKAQNENLQREVYSKKELLKNVEEQQRSSLKRLKEENSRMEIQNE